jgi:sigma-B regulation protein RsbU (phosphoserine phosphatase)
LINLYRNFQWTDLDIAHLALVAALCVSLGLFIAYRRKVHALRAARRRLQSTSDCILGLISKVSESFRDDLDLQSFIHHFTEFSARSVRAQSAAFFYVNKSDRTVHTDTVIGVFPSLFNAPPALMKSLVASPQRMQDYLYAHHFALRETPFVEAVTQQRSMLFDRAAVRDRIHDRVYDCWGMIVVPLIAGKSVYGVVALANKMDRAEFTLDDLHLAEQLAEMASVTVSHFLMFQQLHEKQLVDSQLRTAELILNHLLPQKVPTLERFSIAVHYQPAYRLGGDYYDFIHVDDQHMGILIADVSGKGIPAGLVMATTRSLISVLAVRQLSPSTVLRSLNLYLGRLIPADMFVSATYAVLNTATGGILFARAGHEPIIACAPHQEPCVLGEGNGIVIGMVDDETFAQSLRDEHYHVRTGDMLMFYTDGLTEAHNPDGEEFGRQRAAQLLMHISSLDAQDALQSYVHRVKKFMGNAPMYDDMTIALIKAT